jgi:hypothetical protein
MTEVVFLTRMANRGIPREYQMQKSKQAIGVMAIVGAGIAGIGTLLPWVTFTAPFIGTISNSGIQGDGKLVIVASTAVAAGGIAYLVGVRLWPLVLIPAMAGLAVVVVDLINFSYTIDAIQSQARQVNAGGLSSLFAGAISVSRGTGIYVSGIGLLIALAAGMWGFLVRSKKLVGAVIPPPAVALPTLAAGV